jgi:hypothetical protein
MRAKSVIKPNSYRKQKQKEEKKEDDTLRKSEKAI